MKCSGKVFALKVLNKWEMLKRHQVRGRCHGNKHFGVCTL